MKRLFLLIALLVMALSMGFSQTLMDYVSRVSSNGDTLEIKDFNDMGQQPNSLYNAMSLDTANVPAGRVYLLKVNGTYAVTNNPTTQRPTVIVGADSRSIVKNTAANSAPPVICGSTIAGGGSNTGGINWAHDLTVKNCSIVPADAAGDLGWSFFNNTAANKKIHLQNDYFERTRWVYVNSGNPGTSVFISDCYFVNMNGQTCRRNGGVYDGFAFMDTMWVENSTHVMSQGSMYKFRGYTFNRVMFNHNTFVNCAGYQFLDWGLQTKMSNTNSIFVNTNVQAFSPNSFDPGEQDLDGQPMGLVNMHTFPADTSYDRYRALPRQYLWEANDVYWDPKLKDATNGVVATLVAHSVNGRTDWSDQMIVMNQRSTTMFADNTTYPYLTDGTTYTKLPSFANSANLLANQLDSIKAYAIRVGDTTSTATLPDWRLVNTNPQQTYIYSDWPVPIDLSYTDTDLKGTGGFPIGDLNWFPTEKGNWLLQRDAEYTAINNALNTGTGTLGVAPAGNVPVKFELAQNYPNPFNPTTTISFTLPHSTNATLKVFNALGQDVATLVNGYTTAGTHEIHFDAAKLASGVYFYKLTSGDLTQVKKMVLVK